jgi:hypothetical protein
MSDRATDLIVRLDGVRADLQAWLTEQEAFEAARNKTLGPRGTQGVQPLEASVPMRCALGDIQRVLMSLGRLQSAGRQVAEAGGLRLVEYPTRPE